VTLVAIVDYKLCNLDSIARAVERCGGASLKTAAAESLREADKIVLPGVGAFGAAMDNLAALGLVEPIREEVAKGKPLLGICLGMQLLAERSEESPGAAGLGLIPGEVVRLRPRAAERVPHMGWNVVEPARSDLLFADVAPGTDFYFVHSYRMRTDPAHVVATTPYCDDFPSVVRRGNVAGVQFHPEKSQAAGFALLTAFLTRSARAAA
jgi:glutamine amidotransferase